MRRTAEFVVTLAIVSAHFAWPQRHVPSTQHCTTVRGRYAIYANGDRLRINGSRHFLEVVSDELDEQLQQRGWEETVAIGEFTICSARAGDPKQLTISDNVSLRTYSNIRFQHR